jgi:excisionase family DNA binding protein
MSRKRFYTVKEASKLLGLSESTIRSAIFRGSLTAYKIGARLNVIDKAEVERYRQERLGTRGWAWRRGSEYQPSKKAFWARNYRLRKKLAVLSNQVTKIISACQ